MVGNRLRRPGTGHKNLFRMTSTSPDFPPPVRILWRAWHVTPSYPLFPAVRNRRLSFRPKPRAEVVGWG